MALIVQKFGGTSLANLECIQQVAQKICQTRKAGHQVVVVVSAMSGQTNHLVELAKSMAPVPDAREYSVLVSTGEQVSMALLTMQLLQLGCEARSFTAGQIRILTDNNFNKARIEHIETETLRTALEQHQVAVIAGFQGVDRNGNITTIGRGGSDTTAVALAAALNAYECQIYTDVEGVYTADPSLVSEAKPISEVTLDEMAELASMGAKVLQHRAVEFAGRFQVPLRVLSTFSDEAGTCITNASEAMEQATISGITYYQNEAQISLLGINSKTTIIAQLLTSLGHMNIRADMINQNQRHDGRFNVTFTVERDDVTQIKMLLQQENFQTYYQQLVVNQEISKLSVIGMGIGSNPTIIGQLLNLLSENNFDYYHMATSATKISIIVKEQKLPSVIQLVHSEFIDRRPYTEKI